MSDKFIQWTKAVYWTTQFNPVAGCRPCSPACVNCYAKSWASRFNVSFEPHQTTKQRPPKKGICFCGNITDIFLDDIIYGWNGLPKTIDIIKKTIDWRSDATYLWLTKRVSNMCDSLHEIEGLTTFQHYFGFTAENQEWYDKRMEVIRNNYPEWAKLWISAEPLLGEIEFHFDNNIVKPKWVVCGSESGKNRRLCKIEWIESIVEQCRSHNIPVFVKQVCLSSGKFTNKIEDFPKHLQIRQVPWAKNEEDMKCSER